MASDDRNESFESVDAQSVNNIRYADPGEVQTVIDDAADSTTDILAFADKNHEIVKLQPNTRYDEGGEIHVKPGVILDCNGAILTHSADHNIVFLDNGAHLRDLRADIDHSAMSSSSAVITLDTARSRAGKYSMGGAGGPAFSHATATGTIIGQDTPAAHGIELNGDGAGGAITIGCRFDVDIFRMNDGVRAIADSFINGVEFRGVHQASVNHFHHLGSKGFDSLVLGTQQASGPTERFAYNETTSESVSFWGRLYDPQNATGGNAIEGPNITAVNYRGTRDLSNFSDGSADQLNYALSPSNFLLESITNGNEYRFDPENEEATGNVLSEGSRSDVWTAEENGTKRGGVTSQVTRGVSTTATSILTGFSRGVFALVEGMDQNDVANRFTDLVVAHAFGTSTTLSENATSGSPSGRTYGSNSGNIELTMGSGTYDITVTALFAADA